MHNFVTMRSLLGRVPAPLLEESNNIDWLNWFMEGYRLLPSTSTYEEKVEIFEIIQGKVQLPKYIKELNEVRYLCSEPSDDCLDSLANCVECLTPEPTDLNPAVCQPTISYKLFLDSLYYQKNYQLMRFVGIDKSVLCRNCPNLYCDNQYTFIVTPQKVLHTNLQDGWLCVRYNTEMCDENGEFLIRDYPAVHEFLVYYAIMKHFQERMFTKEEQTANFYQEYKQKSDIWYRKAKSESILRNINPHTVQDLVGGSYINLIKLPAKYVYSR